MVLLRKLLFPFAILYGLITWVRNWFYDIKIFRQHQFDIPVIAVGNLSVGGTGKTPQIEYLIRLLTEQYRIAVLSRGYKRKSSGFILADSTASAEMLGDEPYQFHLKFPEITIAVDANRANGILQLLAQNPKPEVILLDDAFQHRSVKAGFYILLTAYGELYSEDFMLPTGNLREWSSGAKRANLIIVTKCPPNLSQKDQDEIAKILNLDNAQELFFTTISYDDYAFSETSQIPVAELRSEQKMLVAGIAKPQSFFKFLQGEGDEIMVFPDHHEFSPKEIAEIVNKANGGKIVTTEKDFVRLQNKVKATQLLYLPIRTTFISGHEKFDAAILKYVRS